MGIEIFIFTALAALFAIAAIDCLIEKRPVVACIMSFTSVLLIGTMAMAVQL